MTAEPSITERFRFFNKGYKDVSARPLGQTLTRLVKMSSSSDGPQLRPGMFRPKKSVSWQKRMNASSTGTMNRKQTLK